MKKNGFTSFATSVNSIETLPARIVSSSGKKVGSQF